MSKQAETYLAIDLGAESGRVMAGHFDGERIRLEQVHRFANGPVRLGAALHWDVLRLWDEIKTGLARFAAEQGTASGLGVDSWGVDFALLDRNDELIGQPRHYRDPRNAGMIEEACARVPRAEIFAQTGIQFIQINALCQLLAMQKAASPQLDFAHTFLMISDLFHFWLCGVKACEFTNATTSQCYDPRAGNWAKPMLERMGLPIDMFRAIVAPGSTLGPLQREVADECRLPQTLPVLTPASHDTGSAVAAVPSTSDSWTYLSSGTWSLMGVEIPHPLINEQTLAGNFTNEGGACATFRLLKNIMGLWLVQECRRAWAQEGAAYSYEALTGMATEAPPLVSLVDPDDPTFLAPEHMPRAMAEFCRRSGQPAPDHPGAFVRCALESLAMKYRWVQERLAEMLPGEVPAGGRAAGDGVIHIVGGGSQNALLNQFTAEACGRPVRAGPVEATATGNLLMQAVARGRLASLAEVRQVVRNSFECREYLPGSRDRWDEAYARWVTLMTSA